MSLVTRTPMALEIDHRELTNRVCLGEGCCKMFLIRHRSCLLRLAIGIGANLPHAVVGTIHDASAVTVPMPSSCIRSWM
jgi:hypothetical protein